MTHTRRRTRSSARPTDGRRSVLDGWGGGVFVVDDVLSPGCVVAFVVDLEHREVGHEAAWRGTVPVLLSRFEEDAVAGTYDLDRRAAPLGEADPLDHVDGLAVRMRVPRSPCAGSEMDAARAHARRARRCRDGVDVDRSREPVARTWTRLGATPRDVHGVPPVVRTDAGARARPFRPRR